MARGSRARGGTYSTSTDRTGRRRLLRAAHKTTDRCGEAAGNKSDGSDDTGCSGLLQEDSPLELHCPTPRGRTATPCCFLKELVCALGAPSEECIERPLSWDREYKGGPGEQEDDIRTVVVGVVVEADSQEERERKQQTAYRSDSAEETNERAKPDGYLTEGNEQSHRRRCVQRRRKEMVERTRKNRTAQLLLEGSRSRRPEEVRVGELLQPGECERHTEEGPEEKQGATRPAEQRREACRRNHIRR